MPRYWNAEKGGLMHMIYADGRTDPMLTRYPNMFGLFYGYFNAAQLDSVVSNVIFNEAVMKIQTPYMRFYEMEALCALGRQKDVLREIKRYWGGMLRLGATSFWEMKEGWPAFAGAGSLCHGWSAIPVYFYGSEMSHDTEKPSTPEKEMKK